MKKSFAVVLLIGLCSCGEDRLTCEDVNYDCSLLTCADRFPAISDSCQYGGEDEDDYCWCFGPTWDELNEACSAAFEAGEETATLCVLACRGRYGSASVGTCGWGGTCLCDGV